jgi:hypothetical protein
MDESRKGYAMVPITNARHLTMGDPVVGSAPTGRRMRSVSDLAVDVLQRIRAVLDRHE